MKTALILLLVLQFVVLAGPVCGNHMTTAESMDCCEKGHQSEGKGIGDAHASDCCATCDIGKSQGTMRQDHNQPVPQLVVLHFVAANVATLPQMAVYGFDCPASPSPPDIFLLDRSLRI